MHLFLISLLLSLPSSAAVLPYLDSQIGCVDREDAVRYTTDFNIDTISFGGFELCDSTKETKKLFSDISLIERTQFFPDGTQMFLQGIIPEDQYYPWMKEQTHEIARAHDLPWFTAYNSQGNFTMQDGWPVLSTLGRVGTLIHEARHTLGFRHHLCEHGPYARSPVSGCDISLLQKGSHAVEMEYYARVVLEGKNLHPVYKSMARLMALARANFVFNGSPLRQREGLLARTGNRLLLVDGKQVLERAVPLATLGFKLKRTSFGANLVKGNHAVAVDLYSPATSSALLPDDYSYFKNFENPDKTDPPTVLDSEELDIGTQRFFVALSEQGRVYSYDFPNGAWNSPSAPLPGAARLATLAPNGGSGLFIVQNNGTIVPFDFAKLAPSAPLGVLWPKEVRSFAMYEGKLLKLTNNGQVLEAETEMPFDAFAGQKIEELINVPLYNAFELAP